MELTRMDEQKMRWEQVKLEQIDTSKTTQLRVCMNQSALADYSETVAEGDDLPPIRLFHDRLLGKYFIGDGWHAFEAYAAVLWACPFLTAGRFTAVPWPIGHFVRGQLHRHCMAYAKKTSVILSQTC